MILLKKLLKNEFVKGGFFLTISQFLVNILNYFFNFLTGRSLGPSGYGEITTLFSYLFIIAVPISVFSTILVQKISAAGKDRFALVNSLEDFFWSRIKHWWFLILAILIFIPFLPKLTNLSPVVAYSLLPFIFLSFFYSFYGSALQGLRLFFISSILVILATMIKLIGSILITIGVDGINTIMVFLFFSTIFLIFAGKKIVSQTIKKHISSTPKKINRRLINAVSNKQFLLTMGSTLAIVVFNNIDIIFVKKFFSAADAGIYSSWSLFAKVIFYTISPLSTISFIFFSSKEHEKNHDTTLFVSLVILIFVGLGSYLFYLLLGKQIIYLLLSEKFKPVIPYLTQAAIFGSLYTAISFISGYFVAKKSFISLMLFFLMPLYLIFLFLIKKSLINVIHLNISFSFIVFTVYTLFFLKTFLRREFRIKP